MANTRKRKSSIAGVAAKIKDRKQRKAAESHDFVTPSKEPNSEESEFQFTEPNVDSAYYSGQSQWDSQSFSQIQGGTPVSSLPNSSANKPLGRRKLSLETRLKDKFHVTINESPTNLCVICHRFMYPNGIGLVQSTGILRNLCISKEIHIKSWPIMCCTTCIKWLGNGKIPSYAFCNLMDPGDIPDELNDLTDVELRLISRIKPFMKIYKY